VLVGVGNHAPSAPAHRQLQLVVVAYRSTSERHKGISPTIQPMRRRQSQSQKYYEALNARALLARGWIEPAEGPNIVGLFEVSDVADGLQFNSGAELGVCRWSDITGVAMLPKSDVPPQVREAHHEDTFSKSTDPYVFVGGLPDGTGRLDQSNFLFTPVGDKTWRHWSEAFVRAGLLSPAE
jgi:hypothetical protein